MERVVGDPLTFGIMALEMNPREILQRTASSQDMHIETSGDDEEISDMIVEPTQSPYESDGAETYAETENRLRNSITKGLGPAASMADIDRAIDIIELVLYGAEEDVIQEDVRQEDRAFYLYALADLLSKRSEKTQSMEDLDRAIALTTKAVDQARSRSDRAISLNLRVNLMGAKFERTGSMDELNSAIKIATNAIDATEEDDHSLNLSLTNISNLLGKRFERTGSKDDLDCAIELAKRAVEATTERDADFVMSLNNLTNLIGRRYERAPSVADIEFAVEVASKAVDASSNDPSFSAASMSEFGKTLGRLHAATESRTLLDYAIEISEAAVNAIGSGHPAYSGWSNDLGILLARRYEEGKQICDLDSAVQLTDEALSATPQDHPERASMLTRLGYYLGSRYEQTKCADDMARQLSLYREGWNCSNAPPSDRIRAAQNAANILLTQSQWSQMSTLLKEAVDLLPYVSPRSIRHTDKQYMLGEFAGLASLAAAAALNTGEEPCHALQLLESGRGIISGLLMEIREDVSDLAEQHPELADEFNSLRDQLDSPAGSIDSSGFNGSMGHGGSRFEAEEKFKRLLDCIRDRDGFDNFLLPPSVKELSAAALPGPIVVVNLSAIRCDAFLVTRDQIRVLHLPSLSLQEVKERTQTLRKADSSTSAQIQLLLGWLWKTVTCPCLEALGFKDAISDDNRPRVWWVPTGLLCQLPLHAAGEYVPKSNETVLDRVMSSYASSIKALIYGRRHGSRKSAKEPSNKAVLATMHATPGLPSKGILEFVPDEERVFRDICPLLNLSLVIANPRKDDLLRELVGGKIFHFAGHGWSSPSEPSKSCLLLEDWQTNLLTVGDLREIKLQEQLPFLAYLSACSTATNEADELMDEAIHIVSAFQLAGFRHVVGTLWAVSDRHCVDVAKELYKTISEEGMTDLAICRGLHKAVRMLRDNEMKVTQNNRDAHLVDPDDAHASYDQNASISNMHWVPYIHFGV